MAKAPKGPPKGDEGREEMTAAQMLASPSVQSAAAMGNWAGHFPNLDLGELVDEVRSIVRKVTREGDMQPLEAMLTGQAVALQNLFTNLTRRASNVTNLKQHTAYLSLGLKAQAQCRATVEALGELKNPRQVAFVKQANIAQQQQVNNGTPPPRAETNATPPNELLEAPDESRMVPRAASASVGGDTEVEALVAVHRAEDAGG